MNPLLLIIQEELNNIQYTMDHRLEELTDDELSRIQERIYNLQCQLAALEIQGTPSTQTDLIDVAHFHATGERQFVVDIKPHI